MLWGDSLAAHYFHGLSKAADPQSTNILQATQAACMPTFNASAQFLASCRNAASQMQAFFRDNKPDLVILSGDWLEYARPPRFEGMIADLRNTIADLNGRGIRVVLLGPPVQFKGRLPPMLLRLHLRGAEARADDLLLSDVFALDAKMRAALPTGPRFAYVSVLNAMCPARQCPLTLDGEVPLAWDHAHLTAEGSVAVMERLVSMLGLKMTVEFRATRSIEPGISSHSPVRNWQLDGGCLRTSPGMTALRQHPHNRPHQTRRQRA